MLYNRFETENKVDVKPLNQTIKIAAYGTGSRKAGTMPIAGKGASVPLQPGLVHTLG